MNKEIDDGGLAFPNPATYNPDSTVWHRAQKGMTLRDYFAGQALNGLLSDNATVGSWSEFAKRSYEMADAMLAARKGGEK